MSAPLSPSKSAPARIDVVDWLRGLAVVLMIVAHVYDAWLLPSERTGTSWAVVRHLAGIPSRLFLFLVGVSAAVVWERALARGASTRDMRARIARRGLEVLALAYLFRLQEHILANFYGGWASLFRVDILNCIGASMLVVALIATPRNGRPQYAAALAAAAGFIALGPLIGPAHFPDWLPKPLTSYFGGQRPMSWFPLFPWAAWALIGAAVGHVWLRCARDPRLQARCFVITGLLGAVMTLTVQAVRTWHPQVIRYPSDLVQQMGPGSFFYRLGIIGMIALMGWLITRRPSPRFSPMRQFGQTSLFIYWVHVDLCYGPLTKPLQRKLSMTETTIGFVLLTLAMLALSMAKSRYWPPLSAALGRRLQAWRRHFREPA